MKASELRLGNYVVVKYPYDRRDRIGEISLNELDLMQILAEKSTPNPIPLTEEWLVKMGFEKEGSEEYETWTHKLDNVGLSLGREKENELTIDKTSFEENGSDLGFYIEMYYCYVSIKHVHELQNIYFCLSGTELTLKESL